MPPNQQHAEAFSCVYIACAFWTFVRVTYVLDPHSLHAPVACFYIYYISGSIGAGKECVYVGSLLWIASRSPVGLGCRKHTLQVDQ